MNDTITVGEKLDVLHCSCSGTFAINSEWRAQRVRDGRQWFCPYCGGQWNQQGVSEAARLRKQLETEQAARLRAQERAREMEASRDHERNRARGFQGQLTKVKKRVGHGVCPCCSRTFQQLARHMANKHPEYRNED